MKKTLLFSSVFLTMVACSSSPEPQAEKAPSRLTTKTYTAGETGFLVNSHLISGEREAILVDAQFTKADANNVVAMVKQSGKELKTIVITHAHPDHYFGLAELRRHFPQAEVVATSQVIQGIEATMNEKFDAWKPKYKDNLIEKTDLAQIVPTPISGDHLTLEGNTITILTLGAGESADAAALYIPALKTIITGDAVFNHVHLWLAEDKPEGWLQNIARLRGMGDIEVVLPGHGASGGPSLLSANEDYINAYLAAAQKTKNSKAVQKAMSKKYPDYKLPIILQISSGARFQKK